MSYINKSCAFLTGNKKIAICGCDGVIKYTDTEIILSLIDGQICINGSELMLATFFGGEISVTGEIEGFSIKKYGRKNDV